MLRIFISCSDFESELGSFCANFRLFFKMCCIEVQYSKMDLNSELGFNFHFSFSVLVLQRIF